MARWGYKVEHLNISEKWSPKRQQEEVARFESHLNGFGQEGWELMQYEAIPLTGSFSGNVKGYAYLAVFKRELV